MPPAWEYPEGSDVRRIDQAGMVSYDGRRYFVSDALLGERVACVRWDHQVLVTYRHMYVRELQLRTGRSVALLRGTDVSREVSPMS